MASTAGTGYITTASEMTNKLYEENRDYNNKKTWDTLYNGNDVAAAQAQQSLTKSYTDSSVDAYISNLQAQQAIKNSSVVGSSKQQLMDAYQSQYQQNASELYSSYYDYQNQIEQSRQETQSSISEYLEQQGEYSADFTNSHYDYLQYLWDQYELGNNYIFDDSNWTKYTTIDANTNANGEYVDDNGNVITEEQAKEMYGTRLKSWQELSAVQKDGDLYSSIYDENGNLTTFGTEFFDQLENDFITEGDQSWNNWLKENNEELYNWAYESYDYFNYNAAGTNAGTLKTMYGMMSTDNTYSYLERFGGMTDSQISVYFDAVNDAVAALQDYIDNGNTKDKKYKSYYDEATGVSGDVYTYYTNDASLDGTRGIEYSDEHKMDHNVVYVYDENQSGFETNKYGKYQKATYTVDKNKKYKEDEIKPYMEACYNAVNDLFDALQLTPYMDALLEDNGYQRGFEGMMDAFNEYCESIGSTASEIATACVNGAIDVGVMAKGFFDIFATGGAGAVKGISEVVYGCVMLIVNIYTAVGNVGQIKENNKQIANEFSQQMQQFAVQLTDMKNTFLRNTYNSKYSLLY